jgi:hypothetical protein
MRALVKLDPIPLDLRRPTRTPSLPGWLAARKGALAINLQPVEGRYQDVPTLPAGMMLSDDQRTAIQKHLASLGSSLLQTPERGTQFEKATFAAIAKLLLVKPAARTSAEAAEARQDVFMDVLEDIPCWAVDAAIRKWHRGDCGTDERGKPYNYDFAPEPHALRRLAMAEMYCVKRQIADLEPILQAVPFVDTSADLERGRAAFRGIQAGIAGRAELQTMTYDDAVAIGSDMPDTVSREKGEAA